MNAKSKKILASIFILAALSIQISFGQAIGISGAYNLCGIGGLSNSALQRVSPTTKGLSLGVAANLPLNEKWYFGTGLQYSSALYTLKTSTVFGSDINPLTGVTAQSVITDNFKINSLDVPLTINYYLAGNKIKVSVGGGMLIGMNIKSDVNGNIVYSDGSTSVFQRGKSIINPVDFSLLFNTSLHIPINEKFRVIISPQLDYSLTPPKGLEGNFYYAGLQIEILRNL